MRRESEPFTDRSPITVAGSASVRHCPPMSYQGRDRRWCRWVLRRQNGWLPEKDSPNPTLPCRPRGGKSRSEREPAHEVSGPSRGTDGSNPCSLRRGVSNERGPGGGNGKARAVLFACEGAKVLAADLKLDAAVETLCCINRQGR